MSGPPTTIGERAAPRGARDPHGVRAVARAVRRLDRGRRRRVRLPARPQRRRDRKSTRLNSSHGYISYAVFCLKKKKKHKSSINKDMEMSKGEVPMYLR